MWGRELWLLVALTAQLDRILLLETINTGLAILNNYYRWSSRWQDDLIADLRATK